MGLFLLAGLLAFGMLAVKVSGLTSWQTGPGYQVTAEFDNIGGLRVRAPVSIAGVRVGRVVAVDLNPKTYRGRVTLYLDHAVKIPVDSTASIYTQGLLGSNYISIAPGFEDTWLQSGAEIEKTNPAIVLENLIGQFMFNLSNKNK